MAVRPPPLSQPTNQPTKGHSLHSTIKDPLPEKTLGIFDKKLFTVRIGMPFLSSCIRAMMFSILGGKGERTGVNYSVCLVSMFDPTERTGDH